MIFTMLTLFILLIIRMEISNIYYPALIYLSLQGALPTFYHLTNIF